jgi:hypothetical protein
MGDEEKAESEYEVVTAIKVKGYVTPGREEEAQGQESTGQSRDVGEGKHCQAEGWHCFDEKAAGIGLEREEE